MAKIEVFIDGDQVPAVRDLFIEARATGYTGVSGWFAPDFARRIHREMTQG